MCLSLCSWGETGVAILPPNCSNHTMCAYYLNNKTFHIIIILYGNAENTNVAKASNVACCCFLCLITELIYFAKHQFLFFYSEIKYVFYLWYSRNCVTGASEWLDYACFVVGVWAPILLNCRRDTITIWGIEVICFSLRNMFTVWGYLYYRRDWEDSGDIVYPPEIRLNTRSTARFGKILPAILDDVIGQ